jgi:uncharacterized protein (TIGR03435 family)
MIVAAAFAYSQTGVPSRPEFDVASVKPNASGSNNLLMRPPVDGRFTATNVTLKMLIALAYKVRQLEISGGPAWIASDRYDINAKAAADSNVSADQSRLMIQRMLEDRFKLMVHHEKRQTPVYVLLPAKNGLKIPAPKEGNCVATASAPGQPFIPVCGSFIVLPNGFEGKTISMAQLANSPAAAGDNGLAMPGDTSGPSIFTALQEQLGLKLEATKGPVEILVIDHAGKPSAN